MSRIPPLLLIPPANSYWSLTSTSTAYTPRLVKCIHFNAPRSNAPIKIMFMSDYIQKSGC